MKLSDESIQIQNSFFEPVNVNNKRLKIGMQLESGNDSIVLIGLLQIDREEWMDLFCS
jgi:hypothetical protein